MTTIAFIAFLPLAALAFVLLPARTAILACFLGGWLLLPVCHYPPPLHASFPWWITGTAVPSDILIDKTWIAPLVALIGGLARAPEAVRRLRFCWLDLPMAAWCAWPLIDGSLASDPHPAPLIASLYVIGCWGIPWLIGRIWFADRDARIELLKGLAWAGAACAPIALLEGGRPSWLYAAVYRAQHPFWYDGISRYVGYRPLGFFEDGNQYGIWVALTAFAACWVALTIRRDGPIWKSVAAIALLVAIASQSVGAILLLLAGLGLLAIWRLPVVRPVLIGGFVVLLLAGAVHLSGIIPLRQLVSGAAGQKVIGLFASVGRGSFLWRLAQDAKTLSAVHSHPLLGLAQWDWSHPFKTRPWGLVMFLVGQYGLIGVGLALTAPIGAATRAIARLRVASIWSIDAAALPLALIVILTFVDALLNSFIFMPAILIGGAIAWNQPAKRKARR